MDQVIVYKNFDTGGVAVCVPSGEISIEAVMEKDVPTGCDAIIIEREDLPLADSDFMCAWELHNGVIQINLDKAKAYTKERLRFERAPLLAAQDVAFQRALETGADTSDIVAEKQRLRDITSLTDTCTTTAELRSLTCDK